MTGIFDKIFRREKKIEELRHIRFSEIPQFLDEEELRIQSDLKNGISESRKIILYSISDLLRISGDMREREIDETLPTKLRKVAGTALPDFVSMMEVLLSRHFSDSPEQFYGEVVDLLKSVLRTIKGKGKYIAAVMPNEMKEIRSLLDVIGGEVNKMTQEITKKRESERIIQNAGKMHQEITQLLEEYRARTESFEKLWKHIQDDEERLTLYSKKAMEIKSDAEYQRIEELRQSVSRFQEEMQNLERNYYLFVQTLATVLERAEHIVQRSGQEDETLFRRQKEKLRTSKIDEIGEILQVSEIVPLLTSMVGNNELVLKNKNEKDLFSTATCIPDQLEIFLRQYRSCEEQLKEAQHAIESSETIHELEDYEKRIDNIRAKHSNDLSKIKEYERFIDDTKKRIPELVQTLGEQLGPVAGQTVEIVLDIQGIAFS